METAAFSQLTRKYMREEFNPKTPDVEGIRSVLHLANSYIKCTAYPSVDTTHMEPVSNRSGGRFSECPTTSSRTWNMLQMMVSSGMFLA